MYIGDWMARGVLYWPENEAAFDVSANKRFTYRELNARANRLASWLRSTAGVKKGDRVALIALNSIAYLDVFFACGKLGAIFVPYNWRLHPQEMAEIGSTITPQVLIFGDDFKDAAQTLQKDDRFHIPHSLHLDGDGVGGSLPYEPTLASVSEAPVTCESVTEGDILCLLFTGGTTGLPKAAQISYGQVAWNTFNTTIHEINRFDTTITHTPMFHTGGLLVYSIPLLTIGGKVVIMDKWDVDQMLSLVESEGVNLFFAVPTQYQQMVESPLFEGLDLSALRFVTSGGAPLPVPLLKAFQAIHPIPFKQGFGMTEFGPGVFSMGAEFAISKAGSIGRPNFFVEAKLVDDSGEEVPQGEAGELLLRGPTMCSGYFNNPKATAKAIDDERWFHTGDMAKKDEDGFYFIVDRKKDMFISGGENVYPAEIEAALYKFEGVSSCAVIGIPHEKWGEVGRAFVVMKPGASATEAEIITFLKARMARYKVPKSVVFKDALPISAAGKILKRELREG